MKFKPRTHKLPWYSEACCWIGAILLIPLTLPLMMLFLASGVGLYFYDKWNDGVGH